MPLPHRAAKAPQHTQSPQRTQFSEVSIFEALAARSPGSLALIDSSIVRAHQHTAGGKKGARITPSVVLVAD